MEPQPSSPAAAAVAASSSSTNNNSSVVRFVRQCLQLEPFGDLDFPPGQVLREEAAQETLYSALCDGGRPLPQRYRLRVLKELVKRVEEGVEDWDEHGVSDDLMTALTELMALPLPDEMAAVQQKSYVTYTLSLLDGTEYSSSSSNIRPGSNNSQLPPARTPAQITMLESRNLIAAGGTTGLRTWEAALHLGQWLCRESIRAGSDGRACHVMGKRVLELGAGTGYLSILCAKYLGAAQVIASDGSDDVVAALPDNFYLNGLEGGGHSISDDVDGQQQQHTTIRAMDLKWGHALLGTEEAEWNGGRAIDVVLGADITYDKSVIPALVSTVAELFEKFPAVIVVIAATERNRETYEAFLEVCQRRKFVVDEVSGFEVPQREDQGGPFYSDKVPIRICRISKS